MTHLPAVGRAVIPFADLTPAACEYVAETVEQAMEVFAVWDIPLPRQPITPRLSQKLQQTLGGQEGAEFVNWMHEMDARDRDVATHGDFDQLRADIAELRQEMQVGFARLETRFERRFGDLIKWSFVFWVGAVAAIAMLARALR